MDNATGDRILDKASYVRDAVVVLAEKRDGLSFDEYRADRETRDVVEREFQTAIEACIDIGEMLLKTRGESVPETNAEVFERLSAIGIIDRDLRDRMARAAGLRNVLAHKYGTEIDDEDVYNTLQHDLPIFRTYLSTVRDEIDSCDDGDESDGE